MYSSTIFDSLTIFLGGCPFFLLYWHRSFLSRVGIKSSGKVIERSKCIIYDLVQGRTKIISIGNAA
ncbi:hypothetical protein C3F36_19995 [Aeromonas sp. ASNIH2]|nr:hypothetical protein C3F36_19995 [Aeromonas sp. ASNIH2]